MTRSPQFYARIHERRDLEVLDRIKVYVSG